MRRGFRALFILTVLGSSVPANAQVTEFFDRSAFVGGAGAVTVVDFDSEGAGTVLTGNEFAAAGLTIDTSGSVGGGPINIVQNLSSGCYGANFVTEANLNSAPNGISTSITATGASPDPADNFDFILTPARSAAGLFLGNLGNGTGAFLPTTVQFFDEFGVEIAPPRILSDTTPGLIFGTACGRPRWDNRIFYGITSGIPIKTIKVRNGASDGDGITIDDVQFGDPAAPVDADGDGVLDNVDACLGTELGQPVGPDGCPPGFDGGGQSATVNGFLRYASPAANSTALPAETPAFNVFIFYGKTILPATFEATLNRVPFAGFTPAPGAKERVTIPLSPGRNVLVLRVSGVTPTGRTATETDRLVFLVP
ncbi:MAG: hypothetical protein HY824_15950 [Acidobacteria bacterium]|nr:hypothetical protein [Acidobacteriota bacterium]